MRTTMSPHQARLGPFRGIFDVRPDSPDRIVLGEIWGTNDYRVDLVDGFAGGTVLDIGANIGAFTVLAAKAGAGKVVAVEPIASNRERIVAHVRRNHLEDRVVIVGAAVMAGGTPTTRMTDTANAHFDPAGPLEVGVITLPELIDEHGPIRFLKMDIEGAEFQIFEALDPAYFEQIDALAMEWHGPTEDDRRLSGTEFGPLVAKLATYGHLETHGAANVGGLLYWRRF